MAVISRTDLNIVLDCSTSMDKIKDSMSSGIWSTVLEQRNEPGECRVSLYRFSDDFSMVFEGKPAGEITSEECRLVPCGNTALNDAIVNSLGKIEVRILDTPEDVRPELVIVVVITDGQENASKESTKEDACAAIERATDKFGWKFVFLAADPKGFADGATYTRGCAGTSVGQYSTANAGEAHQRYSRGITRMRRGLDNNLDVSKPLNDSDDE